MQSGEVVLVGGARIGATDFSEFDVGAFPITGLTASKLSGGADASCLIGNDAEEGNYLGISGPGDFNTIIVEVDSLATNQFAYGEILARVYKPDNTDNRHYVGPAWGVRAGSFKRVGAGINPRRQSGQMRFDGRSDNDNSGGDAGIWAQPTSGVISASYTGWLWQKMRLVENNSPGQENQPRYYFKWWTGALEDEPGSWNVASNALASGWQIDPDVSGGIGAALWKFSQSSGRIAFLSFTTDHTVAELPTPGDLTGATAAPDYLAQLSW